MPSITTLRPNVAGTYQSGWINDQGLTIVEAVGDGKFNTYAAPWDGMSNPSAPLTFGLTDIVAAPPTASVSKVVLRVSALKFGVDPVVSTTELNLRIRINGVNTDAGDKVIPVSQTNYATVQHEFVGPWSVQDINNMEAGIAGFTVNDPGGNGTPYIVEIELDAYYDVIPLYAKNVRDVASRELARRGRLNAMVRVKAPMEFVNLNPMDMVYVSHIDAPSADGLGWKDTKTGRRPMRIYRKRVDWNAREIEFTLMDQFEFLRLFWDTGLPTVSAAVIGDGLALIERGTTREYVRAGDGWVEEPVLGQVVKIGANGERLDRTGRLLERRSQNLLVRSSFVSGLTGLTPGGENDGGNGADVSLKTTRLLFQSDTPNRVEFKAGDPTHSANLALAWPATASIAANTKVRLSIDHEDAGGEALAWRLQRGVDSNYFNNATQGWGASVVDNTITLSVAKARYISNIIDVGSGATTLTLTILQPSGGTAGRFNYLDHVQLDDSLFATSRIVTDAAAVTREGDFLRLLNDTARPLLFNSMGTLYAVVVPWWNTSEPTSDLYVMKMFYDADNGYALFFRASDDRWVFRRRAAGVSYDATIAATCVRGTPVTLAGRWCSSEGELGLAAFTTSIFQNGVKGTDSVPVAAPTEATLAWLYWGQDGDQAESYINASLRHLMIRQVPDPDSKIARYP